MTSDNKDIRDELLVKIREIFITDSARGITLTGGGAGRWIYDFRPLLLNGPTLDLLCEALWDTISGEMPCQIGGLETAAITIVSGMLMKARERGEGITGFYVRKSRRKDGLQNQIEGNLTDERIVLVDDILNSGKSFMRQIKALEQAGKQVHAIAAFIRYRDISFYEEFHARGIRIFSLFTLDDFPESGGIIKHNNEHPAASPRNPYRIDWKFESPNPSYFHVVPKSAPALDDKRVYFGSDNGTMWALNQSDGSVAWSFKTLFGTGKKRIFSSPAISGDTLYFGAYDGNFYAIDAVTGKKRWVFMEADWIGSSPCIAEDLGLVFVGLEFGLWKKEGALVALDRKTGRKRWQGTFTGFAHASPAYSGRHGMVFIGSVDGSVHAYRARDGALLWTYRTGGAVRGGFAMDEKRGYVCFGSEDHHVYVLRVKDGSVVYKVETLEAVYAAPTIAGDLLYCGLLDKRVICINLDDGSTQWTFWGHSRFFASPFVTHGCVFIGCNDGRLYELDAATGKEISYFQTSERIVNKIAYNEKTDTFFVPTYANELYCVKRISQ